MTGGVTVANGGYLASGTGSIHADLVAIDHIGAPMHSHRDALAGCATAVVGVADPRLLGGGALDPFGQARVIADAERVGMLLAGLILRSAAIQASARVALATYRQVDVLDRRASPLVRAGLDLPVALVAAAGALARPTRGGLPDLPGAATAFITRDPALAGAAVELSTSALGRFPLGSDLVNSAAPAAAPSAVSRMLGAIYRDGRPSITALHGRDAGTVDSDGPPRNLADVMRGLAKRDEALRGGVIDVRSIWRRDPTGGWRRSVIVDITGTRDWNPLHLHGADVADVDSNLRAMAGEPTSFEAGVVLALRSARVRPDEPILLVGHSQGGMVAANLVRHLAESGRLGSGRADSYRITHLITAGSPIGLTPLPDGVASLSLENRGDPVPQLDASANAQSGNHLTVQVDRGGPSVLDRHSAAGAYLPAAADVDASSSVEIRDWMRGVAGFLDGSRVDTTVFRVGRR